MTTIKDYFFRKKETKGAGYDPKVDFNLPAINLKGPALTAIWPDVDDGGQ